MHYGLDFGTTNSVIALSQPKTGKLSVIPVDPLGQDAGQVMRSLLYYRKKNHQKYIGGRAVVEYLADSKQRKPAQFKIFNTGRRMVIQIPTGNGGFWDYKTDITYREDVNQPGRLLQALKTSLRENFQGTIILYGKKFSLEQLIALIITKMKRAADAHSGQPTTDVMIGRPVRFNDSDEDAAIQQRLELAAQLSGFKRIKFIPEPVAAAYDFLYQTDPHSHQTILVFDFGGGTLDLCLMDNKDGNQIIATAGLPLGGDYFNELIMGNKLADHFGMGLEFGPKRLPLPISLKQSLCTWYEIQSLKSPSLRSFLDEIIHQVDRPGLIQNLITLIDLDLGYSLFQSIEQAKIGLSTQHNSIINFNQSGIKLSVEITREEFESMIKPSLNQIKEEIMTMLEVSHIDPSNINTVVCTGGTSYTPAVQDLLQEIFPNTEVILHNVFKGIAAGLAQADYDTN